MELSRPILPGTIYVANGQRYSMQYLQHWLPKLLLVLKGPWQRCVMVGEAAGGVSGQGEQGGRRGEQGAWGWVLAAPAALLIPRPPSPCALLGLRPAK